MDTTPMLAGQRRPTAEMAYLAARAIMVAAGDLVLALACYRTRSVLAGIVSIGTAVLVGLSAGREWRGVSPRRR
jgi:hypothetical protein